MTKKVYEIRLFGQLYHRTAKSATGAKQSLANYLKSTQGGKKKSMSGSKATLIKHMRIVNTHQ